MSRTLWLLCLGVLGLALVLVPVAGASVDNLFSLDWWTMSSGGGTSSGGAYALVGATGRPDAGALAGGDFTLGGGFTAGVPGPSGATVNLYLPLVTNQTSRTRTTDSVGAEPASPALYLPVIGR